MKLYSKKSLELHLFFGRIMKEHALFLKAGFTPAASEFAEKAEFYRKEFELLLEEVVKLSDGVVGRQVLSSGEVVTEFTALAEVQTECLTGIPINKDITAKEKCLKPCERPVAREQLQMAVRRLNRTALKLLSGFIEFKETILQCVQQGALFTGNYPLLIEHILREARLYRKYVETLEREGDLPDPCEDALIQTADGFADAYCNLLKAGREAHDKVTEQTVQFRDFKAAGTRGIQQNKIRSIILPLLADHVLREANHYLRLLEGGK